MEIVMYTTRHYRNANTSIKSGVRLYVGQRRTCQPRAHLRHDPTYLSPHRQRTVYESSSVSRLSPSSADVITMWKQSQWYCYCCLLYRSIDYNQKTTFRNFHLIVDFMTDEDWMVCPVIQANWQHIIDVVWVKQIWVNVHALLAYLALLVFEARLHLRTKHLQRNSKLNVVLFSFLNLFYLCIKHYLHYYNKF